MATRCFNDAFVSINAVDLSDHVTSVTLNYAAEMLDETAMGDTTRKNKGGLFVWSVDLEFKQDWALSNVDATLFPLVGTTFTVIVRPDKSEGVGTANPNYTGTGILENYSPVGNGVGELAMAPITIQSAGALSRATA
jgi:hypothetical protein